MCVPILGAAIGLAGSAVSAIGAKQQAEAQAQQDEYNAQVEGINAQSRRLEGQAERQDIARKADTRRGEGIALASKGNVDPSYGSAALVIFGEGGFAESVDKGRSLVSAEGEATAHENRKTAFEHSAANHRQAGKIAAASSFLGGLGGAVKGFGGGGSGGGGAFFLNG